MADPNIPAPATPAVPGDPYPTNEVGAMVPGINRIPGERDYDPADELAPKYDKAVSQPKPYERVPYMSTAPDLTNPNDLAHPDNPRNKPATEPAFDPYATPVEGATTVPAGTATTYPPAA